MPPPPPPPGNHAPLPEGWAEAFGEDGSRYYWNASTGATSWELPKSTAVAGANPTAAFPPQRAMNDIGSPTAAVKAMNVSASKKAEGLAPRLAALQAANGDPNPHHSRPRSRSRSRSPSPSPSTSPSTALQAANGDLAEARAVVQQRSGELKVAADQASNPNPKPGTLTLTLTLEP